MLSPSWTSYTWAVWTGRLWKPSNFFRSLWQLRPLTAVLVVAAVTLPWYVLVGIRTEGEWLKAFFLQVNVGILTKPINGHGGPFIYYVLAILLGMLFITLVLPFIVGLAGWMLSSDCSAGHLPPSFSTPLLYVHSVFGKLFLGFLMITTAIGAVMLARRTVARVWSRRVAALFLRTCVPASVVSESARPRVSDA